METLRTPSIIYTNEAHGFGAMHEFLAMRKEKTLVDARLKVDGQSFDCHKIVLAAVSPYFKALFTSDLTPGIELLLFCFCFTVYFKDYVSGSQVDFSMYEIEAEILTDIINYAYCGSVTINECNAQNLLAAASMLQLPDIKRACADFMATQLDDGNCIGIHMFAQLHHCNNLLETSLEYILKHFTSIWKGDEFFQLPKEKIIELLSSNELNVSKEEEVFAGLMAWIAHDESKRGQDIFELLQTVRFGLLSARFIHTKMATNAVINSSPQCLQLLQTFRDFQTSSPKRNKCFNTNLRSGMIKPELCFVLIGGTSSLHPHINCYNPVTRETYCMADIKQHRIQASYELVDAASVVTSDNSVYVAGGTFKALTSSSSSEDSFDDDFEEIISKSCFLFDNDHNTWKVIAPMLFPKSNFSLACVQGKIYSFGGLTVKHHPTEIVEKYDIETDRWSYVTVMPTNALIDLRAVEHNDKIYVMGGRTGLGANAEVMLYQPQLDEWLSLTAMPTPRFKFGACVVGDDIFVAGGQVYSHHSPTISRELLCSVEIFNTNANQWRQGPNLPVPMYNVCLTLHDNTLFACGSTQTSGPFQPVQRSNAVYKLHLHSSVWFAVETNLCEVRDFACACANVHTRKMSQVFRPDVDT